MSHKLKPRYNAQDKRAVVAHYALNGSYSETSKELNIPYNTVARWAKSEWFAETLQEIQTELNRQAAHTQNVIATKSASELLDRVTHGEQHTWTDSKGEKHEEIRPMTTANLLTANSNAERSVRTNQVDQRAGQTQQTLSELAAEFRRLAIEYKANVIEGQSAPVAGTHANPNKGDES